MNHLIDQLEAQLANATGRRDKIDIMNALAWELRERDAKRAFALSEIAYELGRQHGHETQPYLEGLASSLSHLGYLNHYRANYEIALSQSMEALSLFEQINHSEGLPLTLSIVGLTYLRLGQYSESLPYFLKSLETSKNLGDQWGIAKSLNGIGLVYVWLGHHPEASQYFLDSLCVYQHIGEANGQAITLTNLCMNYRDLKDYERSLEYGEKCLRICQDSKNKHREAMALNHLGITYGEIERFETSLFHFQQALDIIRDIDDKFIHVSVLLNIGKAYLKQNQSSLSQTYLHQALAIAEESGQPGFQFECHQALSATYRCQSNFELALGHYEHFHTIKQQLYSEEATHKLKSLEAIYQVETALKEAEIYQLKNVVLEQEIIERKEAQEALQASETQLRTITETVCAALFIYQDTQLCYVNPATEVLSGYRQDELLGMPYWELLHPDFQESARERGLARQQGKEVPARYEVKILTKQGVERWMDYTAGLITFKEKPAVLGIAYDITERKRAVEALQESAAHQRRLMEQQTILAEIGRIISASPDIHDVYEHLAVAVRKLLPCDRMSISLVDPGVSIITNIYASGTDIPTRRTRDTMPLAGTMTEVTLGIPTGHCFHPQNETEVSEQFPGLLPLYHGGLRSFLAVPLIAQDQAIGVLQIQTHQPKSYTAHVLELAASVSTQVAGAIAIAELYRERLRAEQALRESEERFKGLFENSPAAIFLTDRNGRFGLVNKRFEEWYGMAGEAVIGKTSHDIFPREYADSYVGQDEDVLERQMTIEREFMVPFADGSLHPILVTKYPVLNTDGRPVGVGTINTDLTESKRAEAERQRLDDQLRQMQKMDAIGTLAGGIAHEFNNVLTGILGFTQLATAQLPPTSPVSQYLQQVYAAGNRAKDLVQQILAFSHPSVNRQKPVHLSLVVQEAYNLLRASLPSTIEMRQQTVPETGVVLADATQLHQVLMNLGSNAEFAMRGIGGLLELKVDTVSVDAAFAAVHQVSPGTYMRLIVRDTGVGMPADIVARIFEPFFTTKGIGEGTGMGLAIVHGIVTTHGGVMTVESALGQGTTFTIYLPQIADRAGNNLTPDPKDLPQGKGQVLFVDDEEMLCRLAQGWLALLGYDVMVHTSSLDALHAFQGEPDRFDLVITDQTMPHMTGEALARELRHIRPDIPIILCTGFSHTIDALKARAMGIDAFCMKPMDIRHLAETIQQVLDTGAARER